MKKEFVFLIVGFLMVGLVSSAGYNIVVPDDSSDDGSSSSSGGGGGGSSSGGLTYTVSANQFLVGYSRELSLNDRIKVVVDAELHYVKLVEMTATTVSINVSSDTQQATLSIGDLRKFDVDGDNNYDLSVKLNSINETSSKADFTVTSVSGKVTEESEAIEEAKNDAASEDAVEDFKKSFWWTWILVVIIVAVAIIVGIWAYFWKRKGKKKD